MKFLTETLFPITGLIFIAAVCVVVIFGFADINILFSIDCDSSPNFIYAATIIR